MVKLLAAYGERRRQRSDSRRNRRIPDLRGFEGIRQAESNKGRNGA